MKQIFPAIIFLSSILFFQSVFGQNKTEKGQKKTPQIIYACTLNAKAVYVPKPEYPKIAQVVKASGEVQISINISKQGKVIAAKIVLGHPLLVKEALKAAKSTLFEPVLIGGKPISATGIMVYNFVR